MLFFSSSYFSVNICTSSKISNLLFVCLCEWTSFERVCCFFFCCCLFRICKFSRGKTKKKNRITTTNLILFFCWIHYLLLYNFLLHHAYCKCFGVSMPSAALCVYCIYCHLTLDLLEKSICFCICFAKISNARVSFVFSLPVYSSIAATSNYIEQHLETMFRLFLDTFCIYVCVTCCIWCEASAWMLFVIHGMSVSKHNTAHKKITSPDASGECWKQIRCK